MLQDVPVTPDTYDAIDFIGVFVTAIAVILPSSSSSRKTCFLELYRA